MKASDLRIALFAAVALAAGFVDASVSPRYKTPGIIGGMGPAATCDLMAKVIAMTDAADDQHHIHTLVDLNTDVPDRTAAILDNGADPMPQLIASAKRLEASGADFLCMSCNTAHYFHERLSKHVSIPILNMPQESARELKRQGVKKVGLLATDGTIKTGVYHKFLKAEGIEVVVPSPENQKTVMHLIYGCVKKNVPVADYPRDAVAKTVEDLKSQGAEAYLLACTELPIAFEALGYKDGFVDPTTVLAKAIIREAGASLKAERLPDGVTFDKALDELLPRPKEVFASAGTVPSCDGLPSGGYALSVRGGTTEIAAVDAAGRRHAEATLAQLRKLSGGTLPDCTIRDWPTYPWRGLMHDCGRNFMPKEDIFKLLDLMAMYKLNLFHWHLTDYYGWRLESKKYPMLQAPWAFGRQQGKFYTQDEFREVVAYAKKRGITVMPELDVPGHSLALRRGLGIQHMAERRVKQIVADLFDELCSLVPAEDMPFVHLGTDEARTPYEMVPDSYCPYWAEAIHKNGRVPVAWTPGKPIKLDGGAHPVRMVWGLDYSGDENESAFDTAGYYFGSKDPMRFLNAALFQKPLNFAIPEKNKLGVVTCSWHDDSLGENTERIWTDNQLALAIVAFADVQWSERKSDMPEYHIKNPAPGTTAFDEAARFEDALAANRDKIIAPLGLPFAYVKQTPLRFRISDAEGNVVATDVAQGTIMIAQCGQHKLVPENSYLMATQGLAFVETWIKSPSDQTIGAWIGFTCYGRSGSRAGGTPQAGEWGRSKGTKVEVNGIAVPAPEWKNPGLKYVMTHVDEPSSNNAAETPFTNEEYFMREPTPISLHKGWNHVKLTVPKSIGDQWKYDWTATFIPVTLERMPREVPGLEYSAQPRQ